MSKFIDVGTIETLKEVNLRIEAHACTVKWVKGEPVLTLRPTVINDTSLYVELKSTIYI